MNIGALLDYESILENRQQLVHLALRFVAPQLESQRAKPIALSLVIDRSGSMSGAPLAGAKRAVAGVVRNLRPDDMLAITVFDSQAQTIYPLQTVDSVEEIDAILERVDCGGATNLTAGWCLGQDALLKAPANMPRRILLLSDGELNHGLIGHGQVKSIVASGLQRHGIRTSCLGFGDYYDEDFLSCIATATNGAFYDATNPDSLPGIFKAELEALQQIVVQNLRVTMRRLMFCDAILQLSDYPWMPLPDGESLEVNIGDLVSGETRTLMFALDVPPMPAIKGKPVASLEGEELLSLAFQWDAISKEGLASCKQKQTVRVLPVQNPADVRFNSEVITWASIQRAGKTVEDAMSDNDKGRVEEARKRISDELGRLDNLPENVDVADARSLLESTLNKVTDIDDLDAVRERKLRRYSSRYYRRMSDTEHWSLEAPAPSFNKRRRRKSSDSAADRS